MFSVLVGVGGALASGGMVSYYLYRARVLEERMERLARSMAFELERFVVRGGGDDAQL